jgi:hypothetical protein
VGRGENRRDAGFYCAIGSIAACEPLKKAQNKACSAIFQLSRRARAQPIAVAFLIMWRTSVLIIWHIWLDPGRPSSGLPYD